jgi:hypothetical protein
VITSNPPNPQELLGRYLTEKKHFSILKNEVKFKAFMPPPNLRLSIYNINGLSLEEIWDIGEKNVVSAMTPPRSLYGVAEIQAGVVFRQGLAVQADNIPPRHANVIGWPPEEAGQMAIAQELAASARAIFKQAMSK